MSIEVKGLNQVTLKLANMAKFDKLDVKQVAYMGHGDVMDHFKAESGQSGGWKSIKRQGKILQDTGYLRNSIRPSYSKSIRQATIRTKTPYAGIHNYGFGKMPQREFMWLSPKTIGRIKELLSKSSIKGFK